MTDSNEKKLGPLTQRFADHLSEGVDYFGAEFASFDPLIATHVDDGVGLMINQVRCKGSNLPNSRKEKALRKRKDEFLIFITDKGISYPALKHGATLPFTKEQSPERAALLFLAAIICSNPIESQMCPQCAEDCKSTSDHSTVNFLEETK